MYDGIEYRGFDQTIVEDLAKYSSVPVWNGLTNEFHPTQMLADVMTVKEEFGNLKGITLCFCGDARNNVGNSLMVVCSKLGMNFVCAAPKELFPDSKLVDECREICKETGATIRLETDIMKATKDADVLYTDVWISMGDEDQKEERERVFVPYQINMELLSKAKDDAIVMHCLPAIRGQEITDDVMTCNQSAIWDQAENRLHAQKAVLYYLFTNK